MGPGFILATGCSVPPDASVGADDWGADAQKAVTLSKQWYQVA
jgi:hypothetical protein